MKKVMLSAGVAALLALSRVWAIRPPRARVDVVFWSLEEPPSYATDAMGSVHHAKALVADYQKDHPGPVQIQMGTTVDRIASQQADLIKGYLKAVGIDATVNNIPQDQYITLALLGDKQFYAFGWRNHGGIKVDQQNYWWNSASGTTDGGLSINFGRLNDPQVDADLAIARSDPDPAKRQAAAEDINRTFAKHCYQIPIAWGPTGIPHSPNLKGLDTMMAPDGVPVLQGIGNFNLLSAWKAA